MKKNLLSMLVVAAMCVACAGNGGSTESKAVSVADIATPADALAALKAGNERYVAGEMVHPRGDEARRDETLNTQKPYAVVVACSDSRVPVELIFDQGIGDIFVIRTAGNSVNDDVVMGSIDYAVDHLNTPLVVVMGHRNCGGVTSAISVVEGEEHHHHGKIGELLEVISEDVEPFIGHPEKLDEAIEANTTAQVERINAVDYISEKVENGNLQVVGAYYDIESGKVIFE